MLSAGYLLGSVFTPVIFNKFNEKYKKVLLVLSFGFLVWGLSNLFYYTNLSQSTEVTNDDPYFFIPASSILGSYYLLIFFTISAGASLASLSSLQGKYLGECSTDGPVANYFTINFLMMGIASLFSFVLLEVLWHLQILSKAKLMFWVALICVMISVTFYLIKDPDMAFRPGKELDLWK